MALTMLRLAAALATLLLATPLAATPAPIKLIGLSDAFDPALLDAFTRDTGIPVLVDGVATPGDVEAALRPGAPPHDLALLPADGLGTRLKAELLQPLPALAEAAAIEPRLTASLPEAATGRAVPFDWYPDGFVIATGKLKDAGLPADSAAGWDLFAKPELLRTAEACGLGIPDRPQDLFALALGAAGVNPGRLLSVLDRRRALATLATLRLQARQGSDAELADGLAQGEFCVALLPAPAAALAIDRAKAADPALALSFVLPAGGGPLVMDVLAIPARAANRDGALKLLRYLLRPEVAAANAQATHVAPATGNLAVPEAFAGEAILARLTLPGVGDPTLERLIEAEWRRGTGR